MTEHEKLALILHLAQCERCRLVAHRRSLIAHPMAVRPGRLRRLGRWVGLSGA